MVPTDDSDWQPFEATSRETEIAPGEFLVRDLTPGIGIAATLSGVDDDVAVVLVVDLPTRHHDGFRTIRCAANPALKRTMDTGYRGSAAVNVSLARWFARQMPENSISHTGHDR